jgi:hypothetical protein
VITEENFLFEGSVADNIRLGLPGASDADVEAAAAMIGAHDFVAALPGGYAAPVGKRGGRLPGGQRQLVSWARASPAAPAVLVPAGATWLPDISSGRRVQEALRTVLAGPDGPQHRPPAVHRGDGRPDAGPGPRADRRGRPAGRAHGRRRRVRRAAASWAASLGWPARAARDCLMRKAGVLSWGD